MPTCQESNKKVISASRRTDLVASFPEWFSKVIKKEEAKVFGPSGHVYSVNISPDVVHTLVLWSKDFSHLIDNACGLRVGLKKYDQLYILFTITGLGGTFIEPAVPRPEEAIQQLKPLIKITGSEERISVRFDPVIFWQQERRCLSNLEYFEELAPKLDGLGIRRIRFSFAQWYNKTQRRAKKHGFVYYDPPENEKIEKAEILAEIARQNNLILFACSQKFLAKAPGVEASSCVDGRLLQELHPSQSPVSIKKDKTQRKECGCTESVDIGSYTQLCPHCCLYCYANPG